MNSTRCIVWVAACAAFLAVVAGWPEQSTGQVLELRYGHASLPASAAGLQAQMLADVIAQKTGGQLKLTMYPSSQIGSPPELTEAVSTAALALSHNTAGGLGSLYEPFAALDTPYMYRDYDHFMKVTDVDSSVMNKLNKGLINRADMRVLYAFYGGRRQFTSNKPMLRPSGVTGEKIRALPFPIDIAAVKGLGGIAVPMDFAELPRALTTGEVVGQDNSVNVVLSRKLYEMQSHLMLTNHTVDVQFVLINESIWKTLTQAQRDAFSSGGREVRRRSSEAVRNQEASEIERLKALNMKVIGPDDGLDLDAYKTSVNKVVQERFGVKFGGLYREIAAIK